MGGFDSRISFLSLTSSSFSEIELNLNLDSIVEPLICLTGEPPGLNASRKLEGVFLDEILSPVLSC